MPTLEWNLKVWDRDYPWTKDGDEWSQQAEFCGVLYEHWKDSLARTFLIPFLKESTVALEIGPGHARWSSMIPKRIPKGQLHLVELSQNCLEFCKRKLALFTNVQYHKNDGMSLPFLDKASVDFAFSFDTFVHIEEREFRSYAAELFRVIRSHGMGVIHHVGNPTAEQRQNGARSMVGARMVHGILSGLGFYVIRQATEWGQGCNLKLTGDMISVFVKP